MSFERKAIMHNLTEPVRQLNTSDDNELGPPRVGFEVQSRLLRVLFIACILTALALLAVLGIVQWRNLHEEAGLSVERATTVAKEHAEKVFDLDTALIRQVQYALAGMTEEDIHREQRLIHTQLRSMIADLPQIKSVTVIGKNGDVLVHSLDYPVSPLSVADREYFIALKQGQKKSISSVMTGRQSKRPVFADSVAQRSESGDFLGVIVVSLDPDYFLTFYREMLPAGQHQSLSLVRADGDILVRYPREENQVSKVTLSSPFMRGIRDNPFAGTVTDISPLGGQKKTISYRRLANQDVYVVSARSLSHLSSEWLAYIVLVGGLLLVPTGILCGIIIFAIRRVRDQKIAWQHWRQELALRHKAESDLRESQKLDALGKLLGRVAHDFNNCLTVVTTGLQIIRLKRITGLEKQLEAIERSVKNGEQLTRQLLGVSRRQPTKPEWLSLQAQLPEWHSLLSNAAKPLLCNIEIDSRTWPICVDHVEMQLALINVLLNARDASPSDGAITLTTANIHQQGAGSGQDRYVRISVSDKGCGMSEETRRQAFDPLFTTKEAGKGTGLGLTQVQNFARVAGGYAAIESVEGAGTTVSIFLPVAEEDMPEQSAGVTETPRPLRSLNLLLVEDNIDVAGGIAALLEADGHAIEHLTNALDAERFLSKQQVDAVISDIHMPGGMTGIELAKKLQVLFPELPVILISGYAEDLQAAIDAGFSVISKPFTIDSLNRALAAQTG